MAQDKVQLPTDGSGKNLLMEKITIGGVDYYAQYGIISDTSGNAVGVTSNRLKVDGSGVTQPVSIANGSDVTEGAIADTAYSDSTGTASGTVIALLKGLFKLVAGTLTVKRALGTTTASTVSVSSTSSTLVAANTSRKSVLVKNSSAVTVYLNFGTTAATTTTASLSLAPDDSYYEEFSSSAITGITSISTVSITVVEVT